MITKEKRNGLIMKRKEVHLKKGKQALRTIINKQEHRPAVFKPKLEVSPGRAGSGLKH